MAKVFAFKKTRDPKLISDSGLKQVWHSQFLDSICKVCFDQMVILASGICELGFLEGVAGDEYRPLLAA